MAQWAKTQLIALCTLLSFIYISESLERHSLTERPRLSSLLVLLLSGCFCFGASFLSKLLPGVHGRFTKATRENKSEPLIGGGGAGSEDALLKGWQAHLPDRPRKISLPVLVLCIVIRSEVFHRVNYMQQCSVPGIESFLCLLLIGYEIFLSRRKWGLPQLEESDDPWRSIWDDLYDWFSGPRVSLVMTVCGTFVFSLGTFLAAGQFTRSTYFCFTLVDSRSGTLLLQFVGLGLDAVITVLLWRLLAWTRTTTLRLRTLGTVLTLSSFCMGLVWLISLLYSGSRRINVPFGSLYGFDVAVDSVAFACLMIFATFWVCETSPITPTAVITFSVGLWSSVANILRLGDWEHISKGSALMPLWYTIFGTILFIHSHDLRSILFIRRIFLGLILLVLLVAATLFTIIKPLPTFQKLHPVNDLVYLAHVEHDRWLMHATASKDVHIAISTYQERHEGRNPPPGFEDWYRFAKGSIIIDDFPQITRDMEPFWSVPPETLRRRAEMMASQPQIPAITIRNGKVSRSDTGDEGNNQDLDEVVDLIRKFSEHIPDMVLPINLSPTPQILPSWEEAHSRSQAELSSLAALVSRRSLGDTNHTMLLPGTRGEQGEFDSPASDLISAADYRQMQIDGCPPGSPARKDPHWNINAFCSECARRHSYGQAITNFAKSLETCSQPDLTYLHGFSMTSPRSPPIRHLVPLFGASKTDEFSDIIIPLPRTRLEQPDIKWQFSRRYDSLIYRGRVEEQPINSQALRGSHKYRLLHMIMNPSRGDQVTMVLPLPGEEERFRYEKVSTADANTAVPFNVGVDGFSACTGGNCKLVEEAYGARADGQEIMEHRYVLLLDENDGPPAQMMRALRSNSVPLVSTVFRTWFTDRLMPWLHFVPIDLRYNGLHSTYSYFTGTESRPDINGRTTKMHDRQKDAEWIAQEGQKWVEKAFSEREMQVYLYRLLLEWGRLLDGNRDKIGMWKDSDGILHDSGWSAAS